MKYTCEIIVNVPLEEFVSKMDNADNMKHWQRNLLGYEFLEGEPGQVGSTMKMSFKDKKREFSLVETIIKNDFPNEFQASYDADGMHNIQKNYFTAIDDNSTKWVSEAEFQSSKLMFKIMMTLMPGMFKKTSKQYMEDFKAFAETGVSVADIG